MLSILDWSGDLSVAEKSLEEVRCAFQIANLNPDMVQLEVRHTSRLADAGRRRNGRGEIRRRAGPRLRTDAME